MNIRNIKLTRTVQVLFGLYLLVFGSIGYIITPPPPPYNEAALAFFGALAATGYMFHVVSIVFILSGLMFLFNKWPAFGALLLAPVTVNIAFFHIFLDFTGFGLALVPILLNLYLGFVYWPQYKPIFSGPNANGNT